MVLHFRFVAGPDRCGRTAVHGRIDDGGGHVLHVDTVYGSTQTLRQPIADRLCFPRVGYIRADKGRFEGCGRTAHPLHYGFRECVDARVYVDTPLPEDVDNGETCGRLEAGVAVVHHHIRIDMLSGDFVHTAPGVCEDVLG